MTKIDKHIEIVSSTISGLSSMGKKSRDDALNLLSKHYAKVRITLINDLKDLETLVARQPDLVFLGIKFLPNSSLNTAYPEKIWISRFLDEHGIAYTGSDQMAHQLEADKPLAKQRIIGAGLETAKFYIAGQGRHLVKGDIRLSYPIFIKPTSRGGGAGIDSDSVVHSFEQLTSKVESIAARFQSDSLLEEYLPGREYSVAILKDEHSADFFVMPIELIAPPDINGERILSNQVKISDSEKFAEVSDKIIKSKLMTLAINAFEAIGARDYGRIDIRLDKIGTPQFLEANLIPSLVDGYGNFPKACMLSIGLNYENMILSIARLGLARNTDRYDISPEPLAANSILFPTSVAVKAL